VGTAVAEAQYVPPVGIPAPGFGVNEAHTRYAGQAFSAGGFTYRDAGNGPYSHYVNRSGGCTDSGNTYGTQSQPRCTIPASLPAGSVVEIHGGTYADDEWTANGTAANPVFIRGGSATKPVLSGDFRLSGSYAIIENIEISNGRLFLDGGFTVVRRSHIHHTTKAGAMVLVNGSNTVVFGNQINNISGGDRHGVQPGGGTSNVWILENTIFECEGDAIQFCHGCIGTGNGPSNVYIGRNTLYSVSTGENAIDIKETRGPVIISENLMYGYRDTATSNGEAVRINDEGNQGEIWLIANRFRDSLHGIQPQNNHSTGVYILGNLFYNLTGSAIRSDGGYVYNNTIYNVGGMGIESATEFRNNIVMNAQVNVNDKGVNGCSNNLLFESSGGIVAPSGCASSTANPLFVNPGGGDFRLQASSPARNAGVSPSPYTTFQNRFGRSIAVDPAGMTRPRDGVWDIGAYESDGTTTTTPPPTAPPAAPTNVRIIR
jgi:hypothetical protein